MPEVKRLQTAPSPNLPIAPNQYSPQHYDVLNNVLRLYFNRIDQIFTALIGDTGGRYLQFPYFSGYQNGRTTITVGINGSATSVSVASTADFASAGFLLIENEVVQYTGKTATSFTGLTRGVKGTAATSHIAGVAVTEAAAVASGSSAAMIIDTVVISNHVTCTAPDSKIYFNNAGIYNIQFSAQLLNYTNSEDNVTIWLKKNGVDVPASAGIQQVNAQHGGKPGSIIAAWNYVDEYETDDYIEFYWSSDTGNTVLATYPPGTAPVHPESPSLILTVTFVSAPQA